MNVVVSFCNQSERVKNKSNLLIIDVFSSRQKWIAHKMGTNGFTGLAQNKDLMYAVYQSDESSGPGIIVIDKKSWKILIHQSLPELKDPHSIAVDNNILFIVSTGTDKVLQYKFDWTRKKVFFEKVLWKPSNSTGTADAHHINSIFMSDNRIYISAFGPKKAEKWSSADDGYIYNVTKNRKEITGIYHPHSVFVKNNSIYYCESSKRNARKNQKELLKLDSGYTRGLYIKGRYLLLGTSSGRKNSKSTGLVNNPADPGSLEADCKLLVYRKKLFRNKYKLYRSFDFLPNHNEIY